MDHGPHRTDMGLVSFPLDCLLIAFGAAFGAHTLFNTEVKSRVLDVLRYNRNDCSTVVVLSRLE